MTLTSHHTATIGADDASRDGALAPGHGQHAAPASTGASRPSFVRTGMPRLSLPPQPFDRPGTAPVEQRPEFRPIEGLAAEVAHAEAPSPRAAGEPLARPFAATAQQAAQGERRRFPRMGRDRRSAPRTYESPWMAEPDGAADPRPAGEAPATPQRIAPVGQVMPQLPQVEAIAAAPAVDEHVAIATPPAVAQAAALVAAEAALDVPMLPADAHERAAVADPLGGIFGAPVGVVATAIDPAAWFPGAAHAAPVVHTTVAAVDVSPPPVAPTPPVAPLPVALPQMTVATVDVPPPPAAPALPLPLPVVVDESPASHGATASAFPGLTPSMATVAPAPVSAPVPAPDGFALQPLSADDPSMSFSTPLASATLPPPADLAQAIGNSIALRPLSAPAAIGATHQAQGGSALLRATLLVGVPAAAGTGIGYLLSLLLLG